MITRPIWSHAPKKRHFQLMYPTDYILLVCALMVIVFMVYGAFYPD